MNGTALSLVLFAAIVYAAWNLVAKGVRGGARFMFLYYSVSGLVLLPFVLGTLVLGHQRPQWTWLFAAAVTAVCHVAYGVVLQRGYAAGDLSVVYPLARGSGPLLSVLAAVLLLGERPGALLQSLLLAPYALRGEATRRLWRERRREVLLVGVLSPVAYLLVLFAMRMAPVSLVAPARELSIVLGSLAAWRVLGEAEPVRRLIGSLVVLAGITAIALS